MGFPISLSSLPEETHKYSFPLLGFSRQSRLPRHERISDGHVGKLGWLLACNFCPSQLIY